MKEELIELLFDQKEVCNRMVEAGAEQALSLVRTEYDRLTVHFHGKSKAKYLNSYLISLNMTLYHYIMFVLNPTPNECCYKPLSMHVDQMDRSHFMEKAEEILCSYEGYFHPEACQNRNIEDACRFIREHLSEELTLEKVASCVYINRCHLCHLFRSCMNMRFSDYVATERVRRAKELLSDDALPIDLVAERCGFSSASYFATVFKKKTGKSPREYRRKMAG